MIHTYTHTYTYIHIRIHTHTFTHTYMLMQLMPPSVKPQKALPEFTLIKCNIRIRSNGHLLQINDVSESHTHPDQCPSNV